MLPLPISIAAPAEATPAVTASPGAVTYQVVQMTNLGGAIPSGTICALDQPFAVAMSIPQVNFTVDFTPSGTAQGSWTFQYDLPDLGETDKGSGTYTISAPAADGSRTIIAQGTITSKFNGGGGTFPLNYQIGLTPTTAACAS